MDNLILLPSIGVDNDLVKAENALREHARNLYKGIEVSYWELGKALYEVWDGVPGGFRSMQKGEGVKEARKALYEKWGYSTFEEWCEREVGIARRSGSSLRHAYWWFEHQLVLPTEVKDRLKKIGRSKIYQLAGFANEDNIITWLDKAEDLTVEELKKQISMAKAANKKKPSDDNIEDGDYFEHGGSEGDSMKNPNDPREAPAPETTHTVTTALYDGQFATWNAALERAKSITNSPKISHNLEMICLDWLGTNDFAKPEDDLKTYMAKMEKLLGLKLIAIDPSDGKPKYGAELLWLMVNSRIDATTNPQSNDPVTSGPDKTGLRIVSKTDDEENPPPAF